VSTPSPQRSRRCLARSAHGAPDAASAPVLSTASDPAKLALTVLTILQERAHLTPEIRRAATNDFSILLEDAGGARAVLREAVERLKA
jgi:hypothetical protein